MDVQRQRQMHQPRRILDILLDSKHHHRSCHCGHHGGKRSQDPDFVVEEDFGDECVRQPNFVSATWSSIDRRGINHKNKV